jgi:hypothetical protein
MIINHSNYLENPGRQEEQPLTGLKTAANGHSP